MFMPPSTRSRLALVLASSLLFASTPSRSATAQSSLDLTLEVGEQRSLSASGVQSYSEGLPGIVDVRLTQEGSFVVLAQRAGRTSLATPRHRRSPSPSRTTCVWTSTSFS